MGTTSLKSPNRKDGSSSARGLKAEQIHSEVEDVLASTPFIDIHTHLFSPAFGKIDVHVGATAIKMPKLADRPGPPSGAFGVGELLQQIAASAQLFRTERSRSKRCNASGDNVRAAPASSFPPETIRR